MAVGLLSVRKFDVYEIVISNGRGKPRCFRQLLIENMLETRRNSVKRTRKPSSSFQCNIPNVPRWFYVIFFVFSVCVDISKCHNFEESDGEFVVTQESIADRHLGRQCRHAHPKHDEVGFI